MYYHTRNIVKDRLEVVERRKKEGKKEKHCALKKEKKSDIV